MGGKEPATSADSRISLAEKIFIGDSGLRAGWRFSVFNLLFFCFALFLLALRRMLTPGGFKGNAFTPPVVALQEVIFLISLMAAIAVIVRIERRPFALDFLPLHGRMARFFCAGLASGLGAITLLIVALRETHALSFDSFALHGWHALKFATWWALAFILVGLFEESFSRGYAQLALCRGLGFWPAALINSAIFAGIHLTNSGESLLGILSVFCVALFFCLTLWRSGTLWFAVGFHAAWDYGETFVYGVPDSAEVATGHLINVHFQGSRWLTGGSVGPEGSVLVFFVYGICALLFAMQCRRSTHVRAPIARL